MSEWRKKKINLDFYFLYSWMILYIFMKSAIFWNLFIQ